MPPLGLQSRLPDQASDPVAKPNSYSFVIALAT
jgi:hypothetical protein